MLEFVVPIFLNISVNADFFIHLFIYFFIYSSIHVNFHRNHRIILRFSLNGVSGVAGQITATRS